MKGIDISMHNGTINFAAVKASGVSTVIIKATQGVNYVDPLLEQHYSGAATERLNIGFYHFMSELETSTPEQQAIDFHQAIASKNYNVLPVLDIETNTWGRDKSNLTDRCLLFLKKFYELSGLKCMIYTGPYFSNDNLDNRLRDYPCWIAHYGVTAPMATTIWGQEYVGHQYTESGAIEGVSGPVDINTFNDAILIEAKAGYTLPIEVVPVDNLSSSRVYVGDDCLRLQCMLAALGYYDGNIDAEYGILTHAALLRFQETNGLVADCKAGPNTFNALSGLMANNVTSGLNYKTVAATKLIQAILGIKMDGVFWKCTEEAVKNFQRIHGLNEDGVVGYNTWVELLK